MTKRQQALADFGELALRSNDVDHILAEACRHVSEALGTQRAKVLEFERGGSLLLRAGIGWDPGIVGNLRLPMSELSSKTFSIKAAEPASTSDIGTEERFEIPAFMWQAGVVAMVNVPIFLPGGKAFGMLQVDAVEPREFSLDDRQFLRTYAAILGPVIDRLLQVRDLRASRERFRLTVEAAPDYAIFASDAEDRIVDWHAGAVAAFGWTAAEAIGRSSSMLSTPEDLEAGQYRQEIAQAIAEGLAPNVSWHLRKDGTRVFVEGTRRALHGPDGALTGFLKIGQDVTDRRRMEEQLRQSERRFRALVTATAEVVYRMSADWSELRQLEGRGFLSDTISPTATWVADYIHPDDRAQVWDAIREAIRTKGLFEMEHRVRRADGRMGWTLSRAVPFLNAEGEIVEWFGAASDIDEQVRARTVMAKNNADLEAKVAARTGELQTALASLHEEVLEREGAEERLRQSEKLKAIGQLTGGIAHDFNNMLQAITSGLSLIRKRVQQGRIAELDSYIDRAEAGSKRAAALTHRLLAFGRQQALTPKPVSCDRVVRDMEDMIRRSVGPAVQTELRLMNGRWLAMCDSNQLESALLNLCINARDAMPGGGWIIIATEELTLSAADMAGHEDAAPGNYVAIAVTDTGTGMTPEVASRAIEPFFTTKPVGQGTGLGLSQIYGFIRQSGGIVQIETRLGQGTTVRLCLPFHEQDPQAAGEAPPDLFRTVLLVEDELDVREMTAEQLRDLGFRVLEARDGAAALRLLLAGAPHIDLLVTDVGLPGSMTGRQLGDAAREMHPGLPVILITGYAAGEHMPDMDLVHKPFDPMKFAELVAGRMGVAKCIPCLQCG